MKTSLFSGAMVVLICYSAVIITTTTGFYCYKQFYLNHLQIVSAVLPGTDSSENFKFIPASEITETVSNDSVSQRVNSEIAPPLPALDPISKNIYLHTNEGVTFESNAKTRIEVPPFAFVDAEGNVIDGEVEMQYREFFRPYEIFLSGIPMQIDSNTLTTSCLFEINASSFGKTVFINPEKPFTVTLKNSSDTNNLYHLNPETHAWKLENRIDTFYNNPSKDNISLSRSLIVPKYAIALKCKTKMELKREHFLGKKQAPDHFIFTFMNFTDQFPEFKELINTNWVYDDFDALRNYYRIFSPGDEDVYAEEIIYCDSARLEKSGEGFVLKISGKTRNAEIFIKPYIVKVSDKLNTELAYEAYLFARENRFATESQQMAMLNNSTIDTLTESAEIIIPATKSKFTIDKFGIWNIGNSTGTTFPTRVNATFVDQAGRKIEVTKIWFVMKNINALFSTNDFANFSIPSRRTFFWTLLEDGKIGIVYPEELLRRKAKNGEVRLVMRVYESGAFLRAKLS